MDILLLHGALGCGADLEPLANALRNRGLKPGILNFSGHGGSAFNDFFTIEQFAGEIHHFLMRQQNPNLPVFGYSMGGYVALYNAARHRYHRGPVFTLGTKFDWSAKSVDKETAFLNPALMTEKAPAFVKALEQKHGQQWQALAVKTAGLMRDIHTKNYLGAETFAEIGNKVTLSLGANDQMVSKTETLEVVRHLSQGIYVEFTGAKHPLETVPINELSRLLAEEIEN